MSQRDSLPLDDGSLFLTDAGMETALIFHQGQELPSFATFPLLESEDGRDALRTYYEPFLELARTRGTGFILGGCTWRASADWGAELGYDARGHRRRQPPRDRRSSRSCATNAPASHAAGAARGADRPARRRLRALVADDRRGGRALPLGADADARRHRRST